MLRFCPTETLQLYIFHTVIHSYILFGNVLYEGTNLKDFDCSKEVNTNYY